MIIDTHLFFACFILAIPHLRAGTYCLSRCQGIWFVLRFEKTILPVSPLVCRVAGFIEARRWHLPFPQRAQCLSSGPLRRDTVEIHSHTHRVPSHKLSDPLHPKLLVLPISPTFSSLIPLRGGGLYWAGAWNRACIVKGLAGTYLHLNI